MRNAKVKANKAGARLLQRAGSDFRQPKMKLIVAYLKRLAIVESRNTTKRSLGKLRASHNYPFVFIVARCNCTKKQLSLSQRLQPQSELCIHKREVLQ
jgi:hypothetical protein